MGFKYEMARVMFIVYFLYLLSITLQGLLEKAVFKPRWIYPDLATTFPKAFAAVMVGAACICLQFLFFCLFFSSKAGVVTVWLVFSHKALTFHMKVKEKSSRSDVVLRFTLFPPGSFLSGAL